MNRKPKESDRSVPALPDSAARITLAAPLGKPVAHAETFQPVTLIGGRRDCDLPISLHDVSKIHCALVNTGTAIIATDLSSRSGTFVNGEPISVAALHPGDDFQVGSVPVDVQFSQPPEGSTGAPDGGDEADALSATLRLKNPEHEHMLTTLPAVIGRRQACQVVLDTPDVSLAHALLFVIQGTLAICDLGSRSGTYLNGDRVTLARLHDGDRLCIGGEELAIEWDGPQLADHDGDSIEAADMAHAAETKDVVTPIHLDDLDDLGSMVESLKAQVSASQAQLRRRADSLDQREAELEMRVTALENERCQLATEKQRIEEQKAELATSASGLERERAQFEGERVRFERERAEAERLSAEREEKIAGLRSRKSALDKRQTALATAEAELSRKQAELTRREIVNVDTTRRIEQFKKALGAAREAFATAGVLPDQITGAGTRQAAPKGPEPEPRDRPTSAAGDSATDSGLPAPLVDAPLFAGPDAASAEQVPPGLQERSEALRRLSDASDADTLSQPRVAPECRAQQPTRRAPPRDGNKKRARGRPS